MKIMGIDPGIERVGYAVIEIKKSEMTPLSYGLITTDKVDPKPSRLFQIYSDLNELISRHCPDVFSIETLLFAKNVKTAMTVSEARGVILLAAAQAGMEIFEFTPLQVKSVVTGYGKASKSQVQAAVKLILSLSEIPKPDDVADALAIAIAGATKYNPGY